jgi:ADP-dependent glucokinase
LYISLFAQLQLIGPIGPQLRELLHQSIAVPESSLTPADQVHLILEYSVGEKWGQSVAPVATRFITSHDMANSEAKSLENFFDGIVQSKPDLVVLSGLHMLEGQPSAVWGQRLKVTGEGLLMIGDSIPVHLELASMANEDLVRQIAIQVKCLAFNYSSLCIKINYLLLINDNNFNDHY